jgi:uncharacterized SAM-binding protein YcdF (DUF218 family)
MLLYGDDQPVRDIHFAAGRIKGYLSFVGQDIPMRRCVFVVCISTLALVAFSLSRGTSARGRAVEAIVVPGGGSQRTESCKSLPEAVTRRLDLAIHRYHELHESQGTPPFIFVLSAGTVHRPNYISQAGWPVLESTSEAQYIVDVSRELGRPIPTSHILRETTSLDTIGNAYFLRVQHIDTMGLSRMLVITSAFHLERTKYIFEFVFHCASDAGGRTYSIEYEGVSDDGLNPTVVAARVAREANSLNGFRQLLESFGVTASSSADVGPTTRARGVRLKALHRFLFTKHTAYATQENMLRGGEGHLDQAVLETY